MTNFTIKCETFARLAKVCSSFSPRVDSETMEKINVVRFENFDGHFLAIVTNQAVACIERIGEACGPEGHVDIKLDKVLLTQIQQEALYGSLLTVTAVPEIAVSNCMTTTGFQYPNCCAWHDDSPLDKWHTWGVPNATQSIGSMYWDLEDVEVLFRSSPTGKIVFPKFIDAEKPVTLRDRHSEDWVGLFIPKPNIGERVKMKADLPEWWKK